ncbi:MAG: DUF2130 domain-containing protein [Candidatus Omnitrophica bacterium]|nr:DUF2130 domain-containing protein [Candidatus Omnitrophota bacterium]
MNQEKIKCPECGHMIELSEAISHDIEDKVKSKFEQQIQAIKKESQDALTHKEEEFNLQLTKAKADLTAKAQKEALESVNLDLSDLKAQLDEKTKKLQGAEQFELKLRKKTRELEEKEKSLELEIMRKLDEERKSMEESLSKDFQEQHRLKDAEKEKQLSDMRKQIEDLQRKAEQGSQQNQGEVLELELEDVLKTEFPLDEIEPIGKGQRGADVLQIVKTQFGRVCGKILWETKRTKNWSDGWIQKLKDDQREAKADICVIVSEALPSGLSNFNQTNGVWVCSLQAYLSLAIALRVTLIQVASANLSQEGKNEKMEIMYKYLTGSEFRNRVEAIVESFVAMKSELEAEKRAIQKIWSKREKQIENVITHIGGMHGDLQGIVGSSLPTIKMLELDTTAIECGDDLEGKKKLN